MSLHQIKDEHLKICFVCTGGPDYHWSGHSYNNGLGGSETCLVKLAEEFVKFGHEVVVYNNCAYSTVFNNVCYLPIENYKEHSIPDTADLLISWRNWYPLIGRKAKVKVHSTHDVPNGCHHPCVEETTRSHENAFEAIDFICYLNSYHRNLTAWWPADKSTIIPVGVETEMPLELPERDPYRCITLYHPNRGLDRLRSIWPKVKKEVPEATLTSYWWEPAHFRSPIPELGVAPMQSLSQKDLLVECLKSGAAPYPSVFQPEISPVSVILPQVGGAFPVTIVQGGMVDVLHPCAVRLEPDVADDNIFAECLISTLQRTAGWGEFKDLMQHDCADRYSWESVAISWLNAFNFKTR